MSKKSSKDNETEKRDVAPAVLRPDDPRPTTAKGLYIPSAATATQEKPAPGPAPKKKVEHEKELKELSDWLFLVYKNSNNAELRQNLSTWNSVISKLLK